MWGWPWASGPFPCSSSPVAVAGGAAVRCARTVKTGSPRETSETRTHQWLPTKDNEGARVCSRLWPNSELTLSKVGEERRGEERRGRGEERRGEERNGRGEERERRGEERSGRGGNVYPTDSKHQDYKGRHQNS